ncbi:hypothetical protein BJV82DRAFT_675978 [Fennellomyces sp. T-0311]|nr:hypothetical protein BJV82DRAFT_675978 [Fennellomyces sp. T-0311]
MSPHQAKQFEEVIRSHLGATSKELQTGMSKKIGHLPNVKEIHPGLQNINKLTYHKNKVRKGLKDHQGNAADPNDTTVTNLREIQRDFPGFITTLSLLEGEILIAFRPPSMPDALNLSMYSFITDTTFTLFDGGYYLCTSVIFCEFIQRHPIAFAAVMDGMTARHYQKYFLALLTAYKITFMDLDQFIGVIIDFSDAQRKGFLEAYHIRSGKDNGIQYIKGCTVYFERNAKRLAKAYTNDVHGGSKAKMYEMRMLLSKLHAVETKIEYKNILKQVLELYPQARQFVAWWNCKDVRGTIFPGVSTMNQRLFDHLTTTTNAVESQHNAMYHLIRRRQSLGRNLRHILKFAENDENAIQHYMRGYPSYYGSRKLKSLKRSRTNNGKGKTKVTKYRNDGRAPDTQRALCKPDGGQYDFSSDSDDDDSSGGSIESGGDVIWAPDDYETTSDVGTSSSDLDENDLDGQGLDELDAIVAESEQDQDADPEFPNEQDYHRSYLLLLCQNRDSSCYIDAPMELMLHAVMPFIISDTDPDNEYDDILRQAYHCYQENTYKQRSFGLEFDDAAALFEHFISNFSERVQEALTLQLVQKTTCRNCNHEAYHINEINEDPPLIHVNHYQLSKRRATDKSSYSAPPKDFATLVLDEVT